MYAQDDLSAWRDPGVYTSNVYINVQHHDRANSTINTSKSQGEMAAHPTSSRFEG